jgi:hypothetical protein
MFYVFRIASRVTKERRKESVDFIQTPRLVKFCTGQNAFTKVFIQQSSVRYYVRIRPGM